MLFPVIRPTTHSHRVLPSTQQPPSASCVLGLRWMEPRDCLSPPPPLFIHENDPGILVRSPIIPALIKAVLYDPDDSLRAHTCLNRTIPCQIISDLDSSGSKMSGYTQKLYKFIRGKLSHPHLALLIQPRGCAQSHCLWECNLGF